MKHPNDVIDRDVLVSHMDGVRRLARSLVRDDTTADDVVQEAMVAALETRRPVKHSVKAWLSGVVRNVVRRDHRSASRRSAREEAAAKPEATPSVAEAVVQAAEQSRILDMVVNMAEPYRSAILLRFVQDLPPRAVAEQLGLPVETVRTQVKRGLAQLRGELDRRHGGRARWMGVLSVVASGPALGKVAPKVGSASGAKIAVSAVVVAAIGFTAWWSWTLAFPEEDPVPDEFELDDGRSLVADTPEQPPEIVLKPLTADTPKGDEGVVVDTDPPPQLIVESEVEAEKSEDRPQPEGATPTPRLQPTNTSKPDVVKPEPDRLRDRPLGSLQADTTGGLVEIPEGNVWIGTPLRWVEGRAGALGGRNVPSGLFMETPRHLAAVGAFSIDRYEVTNAQYHRFLIESSRVEYEVRERNETLDRVAEKLVRRDVPANLDWDHTVYQLYRTNFATLHAQDPGSVRLDPETKLPDFERTFEVFRKRALRRRTMLLFYDRPPPGHWPSDRYEVGSANQPVRFVSQREAAAFANWAGKHLPTELEWEYASRGADGWAYPWGGRATGFATRVNGGGARNPGEAPFTVDVDQLEGGVSIFGIYNTLGNVSEWTSSVLTRYPESTAAHWREGRVVVVRGGSAADQDRLVVRPAFRGWRGDEPLPNRRREWTGFRCALYAEPARSRLPDLQTLLSATRTLPADALDLDSYAGAEATALVQPGAAVENAIFVTNQAYAVLGATLRSVGTTTSKPTRFSVTKTHALRETDHLLAESEKRVPVVFGMIYTDVPITSVFGSGGKPFDLPKTSMPRRVAPPGAYLVGLYLQRLVLMPFDGDLFYISRKPVPKSVVNVVKRSAPRRGEPSGEVVFRMLESADLLRFEMTLPLGGGAPDGTVVVVRFQLGTERRALRDAQQFARWQFHPR